VPGAAALLDWYAQNARDLPWRHPRCSAWGVLVSEIMLQQTPVSRVLPVWADWMRHWPAPSSLAADARSEAVRAWGKLGYPRRALRLHEAATAIAARHGDEVPSDVAELRGLPGVGEYTARAVAAFAHGRRVPVVDTNVRRVVARAVHGRPEAEAPSSSRDHADVAALLPAGDAAAARFSAALMELGALVCTARSPRCADCPLAAECAWYSAGRPHADAPARKAQRFAGTDRQVRGLLLDVLRGADGPVGKPALDVVWTGDTQRERCLASLLDDGLLHELADGRFALPGERSRTPGVSWHAWQS
jgi:A/G-specific adenine glycosylase